MLCVFHQGVKIVWACKNAQIALNKMIWQKHLWNYGSIYKQRVMLVWLLY
jgi:hypothetical protein